VKADGAKLLLESGRQFSWCLFISSANLPTGRVAKELLMTTGRIKSGQCYELDIHRVLGGLSEAGQRERRF